MFQKAIAVVAVFFVLQANAALNNQTIIDVLQLQNTVMDDAKVLGLNWSVGDVANYNLNMGFINGTMEMKVREEVTEGFWVEQNIDMGFLGKQKVEILFDKNNGQILQFIVNGEKQDPPTPGNQEVEEMKEANIQVPAGTFDCIYIRVRDLDKNETTEAWVNPQIIPIAGLIKTIAPGPLGEVTVELTSFDKR